MRCMHLTKHAFQLLVIIITTYLLACRAFHDGFVVVQINLEASQVSVVDAQHAPIQVEA